MAMMATIFLIPRDLDGKLDWVDPMQCRCGSGQLPLEEIRTIAPVVNISVLDGVEIPPFKCSSRGGKDGFPKVRVFDKSGGGNQIYPHEKFELRRRSLTWEKGPREDP